MNVNLLQQNIQYTSFNFQILKHRKDAAKIGKLCLIPDHQSKKKLYLLNFCVMKVLMELQMCWLFGFLCCNAPVDLVLGYLVVLSGLAQTYNEMFPCFPLTYSTVLIEQDNCMTNWLSEQWELPPAHNSSTLQTVVHIHVV